MPAAERSGTTPLSSVPTRRPYLRADDRRRQLLDATAAVYRREGLSKLTMVAVADEAGVSRRLLYNHFPDLDALVLAFLQYELGGYLSDSAVEFDDPERPIRDIGRSIVRRIADLPREHRNLIGDLLNERRSPELLAVRQLAISTIAQRWSKLLPEGSTVTLDPGRITVLAHVAVVLGDLMDRGELSAEATDSMLPALSTIIEQLIAAEQ